MPDTDTPIPPQGTETPETPDPTEDTGRTENGPENQAEGDSAKRTEVQNADDDTFTREYVQQLRDESARYRQRAGRADDLAERLMAATIREATQGILADPTDLVVTDRLYGDDGYPDPAAITEAAKSLVERKPHLAPRVPAGDVGQGARPAGEPVDLAGLLRART
jgi:hypothetical protein